MTPITRDMYTQNGVPWYKLFDDYVESVTTGPSALSNVRSVTQLDEENSASFAGAESQLDNLIDPKSPPDCSFHPSTTSSCVFRPCGHLACTNCVGSAVLSGYKCPKCQAGVDKFVGMQAPLSISRNDGTRQEGEWSTEETEKLAATAASSDTIIVVHQLEDRPSPLYMSRGRHFWHFENKQIDPRLGFAPPRARWGMVEKVSPEPAMPQNVKWRWINVNPDQLTTIPSSSASKIFSVYEF